MKNPQKVNLTSSNLSEEKLIELYRILPEAFAENKIDFDKLRTVLGDSIVQGGDKFSFSWAGKSNAIKNVLIPSHLTLNPVPGESIKWDESENLFIEGDNLEVLKLLQKAYFEKVKMIYIDPPYNTGHDFVYNDDFSAPLDNYLKQTGQKNGDGDSTTTNKETNGRYHSDWLSMMYPRLKLAWNLLSEDGVIFVSIDDNEVHHLRMVMDEVFGGENFQGHIHWRRRHNQPNDATKMIGLVGEHIIVYAKDSVALKNYGVGKVGLTGTFSNPDNDPRGDWASKPWKVGSGQSGSRYVITTPTGVEYDEDWMGEQGNFEALLADNRIIFPSKGKGSPRKKYFKHEREQEGQSATNWWSHEQFGSNQDGTTELAEIFGQKDLFDNPKPTKLIENLISVANVKSGEIILDFFAGSSSTGHAVINYLADVEVKAKFILVQLPEALNPDNKDQVGALNFLKSIGKKENIAELSKERIRRVINGYGEHPPVDSGFKLFTLAESNYPENNFVLDPEKSPEENQNEFVGYLQKAKQKKLFDESDDMSLVYENIVKEGLSLNSKVTKVTVGKNNAYQVVDGEQQLLICLEDKLASETVKELTDKEHKDRIFICLESSLDDTTAANLALNLDLKTI